MKFQEVLLEIVGLALFLPPSNHLFNAEKSLFPHLAKNLDTFDHHNSIRLHLIGSWMNFGRKANDLAVEW